jgi:hypothetical protein
MDMAKTGVHKRKLNVNITILSFRFEGSFCRGKLTGAGILISENGDM